MPFTVYVVRRAYTTNTRPQLNKYLRHPFGTYPGCTRVAPSDKGQKARRGASLGLTTAGPAVLGYVVNLNAEANVGVERY
jgi:hypothetical protein